MSLHMNNSKHVEIKDSTCEKRKRKKEMLVSKYRVASLLMGLLFCLMGLVFSTVEPIKTCKFLIYNLKAKSSSIIINKIF